MDCRASPLPRAEALRSRMLGSLSPCAAQLPINEPWQLACGNAFGLKWGPRPPVMMDIRSLSSSGDFKA